MTRTVVFSVLVLLAVGAPSVARAQERAALMPAAGVNVHEGYLSAAQQVARDYLEQNGFAVAVAPGAPGTMEMGGAEAIAQAREMGARYAVVVTVTRLGSSAKVKLTVYDASANVVSYRGQLTAGTPDDLDAVMARLVKGLATGQAPADTADIETVTDKESDPLNKMRATSVFGVRMGAVVPLNSPDGAGGGLPGLGVFWLYDMRTFLAEVGVDFHAKDGDGDFTVDIGAYYPLTRANTTAYVGGGMRYGFTEYGGEGGSGLALFGAGGVLFGRLSTVQLRGELLVFQNLFTESEFDGTRTNRTRNTGAVFSVGLGF
jgi:hypothetical protein